MIKGGIITFYYDLIKEKKKLEIKISQIQKRLEKLPKENLSCAKNGRSYKWYSISEGSVNYIYKKEKNTQRSLLSKSTIF